VLCYYLLSFNEKTGNHGGMCRLWKVKLIKREYLNAKSVIISLTNEQHMSTPGSVVVWEWLSSSTHWLPYEPVASNYIETFHSQWQARGGATAWPNQSSVVLKNVSLSLAQFVIDLNTMSQTNQSTGNQSLLFLDCVDDCFNIHDVLKCIMYLWLLHGNQPKADVPKCTLTTASGLRVNLGGGIYPAHMQCSSACGTVVPVYDLPKVNPIRTV